jgi:hypothetical protein
MSCSGDVGYQEAAQAAMDAIASRAFVDAFTCTYANVSGGLVVVGTLFWFTISAMSYVRTGGSFAMPVIFTLIFGGAVLSQVTSPVLGMAAVLILGGFALVVVLVARRMDRP